MGIKKFNAVQGFSVGQNDTIYDVIDSAANVTANNLTVTGNTDLGAVANVKITGGTANYVLKTDGLGNLSWENPADVGVIGSNTEVQFNDNGLFGSSANFTFNKSTKTLTVDNIVANGIGLTNMNGANVTGTIANANYAAYSGNITIAAQPNITSVGTLVSANITGNLKSGNANLGNLVVANYISGDGYLLGNLTGANVVGAVSDATTAVYAGTVTTRAQPNITSVGTLVSANITGNLKSGNANLGNLVTANYFTGDGGFLSNITGSNVVGAVSDATTAVTAGTVTTRAQPNITSVGTLVSANISGNITSGNANLGNLVIANYFSGSGSLLTDISGSNITSQVANALVAGTVYANAQPNITSVGTLVSANVSGNITSGGNVIVTANVSSGNANLGNLVTANYFTGNGSLLSSLTGGNVTGQVANALIATTITATAQPNISSVGTLTSLNVSGNITSGGNVIVTANVSASNANLGNLVTANYFSGSGNLLANIQGANVSGQVANALIAGTVYTNAQPNITSLGTLSSLAITGDATINGNVTVTGSFEYANVTTFRVKDPIIEQGGNTNGSALSSNDGYDRGQLLHYFSGTPLDAFMGWDNSNAEFALGSIVTVTNEVVTFNTFGNLRAGYFLGNGSQLTGIIANANFAAYSGVVTNAVQPNITSVGTLSSLNVTANVTSGNATLGNLVTANYFTGNGSLLTAITGANVTGFVPNANVSNTAYSITGANVTGQVANALIATTVTANAQPNITSVGTLVSANVSGNITSGNATLGNLVTANYFTGNGSLLTTLTGENVTGTVPLATHAVVADSANSVQAANVTGQVANALIAGTVYTNAQPNITSVGILVSANVSGNITSGGNVIVTANVTSGNATLGNLVTANYFSGAGNLLSNIVGGNVTGQVANALIAGTVYTNTQPNITSVGTLVSANVSGNITSGGNVLVTANISSGNADLGNLVTANYFKGDGSLLTNITGANITSQVASALVATTVTASAQPNITSVGTLVSANVSGNITSGGNVLVTANISAANANLGNLVTANYFSGAGNLLSNIVGGNVTGQVANALIAGTVYTNAQPNITSVGTLVSANVSGNITSGGNVIVTANISSGNANLGNLVTANYFSGAGNLLSNIVGGNVTGQVANSLIAGTVYTNAQPNITSVGTLSSLTVSGDTTLTGNLTVTGTFEIANVSTFKVKDPIIEQGGNTTGTALTSNDGFDRGQLLHYYTGSTATDAFMGWDNSNAEFAFGSNVSVTSEVVTFNSFGNVRANYFLGNGSALTTLTGSNVTGQVANALIATTVTANAQPNITSVGTLSSLTVTANISSGNANLGNLATASYFSGSGNLLANIQGANVSGQVANALIAGTVYTNAQPNITSVGTLSNLTVTANISSGNANLGNLVTSNYFTGVLTTDAQPNITSVGSLSGLTVSNATGTVNLVTTANVSLGSIANLHITGGTSGYVMSTDGSGTLTWTNPSTVGIAGANTQLQFNDNGSFGASANLSFNKVTGLLSVTGNVQRNGKSLVAFSSGSTAPSNPVAGDEWYDQLNDIIYKYIFDGVSSYWIDSTSGYLSANVAASANTLVQRDGNGNVTANYFIGDGSMLTGVGSAGGLSNGTSNISAGIINGNITVGISGTANTVIFTSTGMNVIATGGINAGNTVTSNYFIGAGNLLSNIVGGNVTGQVANALIAGTVTTAAQPNITSTGTLVSLTVTGNLTSGNANLGNLVTANYFSGNGSLLTAINGSNVTGTVANATYAASAGSATSATTATTAGTVTTAAQPNITSVGTLSSLAVTGNISGANLTGNHYGNGSALTALNGANVTGQVANALVAGTVYTNAQPNITSVGTLANLSVTGNITAGSGTGGNITGANLISANYISGNGSLLTSITGGNVTGQVANALVAGTVYTNAQPNITSIGSLSGLTVSNATGVVDFTTTANVTLGAVGNLHVTGGTTGQYLQTNGSGGLSWVTIASGSLSNGTSNISAGTVNGNITVSIGGTANTVVFANTGVNIAGYAAVTGNISSGNANLGNLVIANYFTGNGSLLTSLTAGNVVGQVANALVAGTVYTAAQPNITSVGTLTSLMSGLITATSGGIKVGNIQDPSGTNTIAISSGNVSMLGSLNVGTGGSGNVTATYFIGNGSQLTGLPATYANSNVAAYLPTYTGNITGNIITLTGNVSAINANLGNLVTANYFTGNGSLLTGLTGANITGQVANALVAGTVYTNAQPNITSVGTLVNLAVTSNIVTGVGTGGSISGANSITSNYFIGSGNLLSNIVAANISGQVANALVAGTVYTAAQPNITSVGTLSGLTSNGVVNFTNSSNVSLGSNANVKLTGGTSGQYLYTDGTGNLAWSTIATAALSNGTSNVSIPTVNGNVVVGVGGNTTMTVTTTGANVSGYLAVTGNISSTNANLGNLVTSNYFAGNGSLLTAIAGANVTGFVANANIANTAYSVAGANVVGQVANALIATTITDNAQPNITSVGTLASLVVTGTLSAGDTTITGNLTVTGNYEYVNTTILNVKDPVIEQGGNPNGVALSSNDGADRGQLLHYYSGAAVDAFMGWKNAAGEFVFASNATLASNNVTTINQYGNIHTGNANLGNLATANYFTGNGSLLTGITGANVTGTVALATHAVVADSANSVQSANITGQVANALVAGTVYTNAQPNITSVGTLVNLTVTGNISSGNANLGNLVTANYFTGNGSLLTSLTAGNLVGQVANALVAGTVYTAAQPNITSVGTLASLNVTGNVTASYLIGNGSQLTGLAAGYANANVDAYLPIYTGNITGNIVALTGNITSVNANLGNLVTANFFTGNGSLLTSLNGSNVTGQVANALVAGTVYTNAQPNITSVGTLSSVTVSGVTNLGVASNVKITGGGAGYALVTDGSGNLSWSSSAGGGSASFVAVSKDNFVGDSLTNAFVLSTVPSSVQAISVNINGLIQQSTAYALTGSTLSFASAPVTGVKIEVTTYGVVSISTANTQVQYSNGTGLASSAAFTFNDTTNALSVSGNVTSGGNLVVSGGTATIGTGLIAVASGNAGIFTSGIGNINIGLAGNVTLGGTSANVTARGNFIANTIVSNSSISGTSLTADTVNSTAIISNRTPITVTGTTVIDTFPLSSYRTAKYTIRVASDDGYQSIEALLIHDASSVYITVYGSISTSGFDIVLLSSGINSGNVELSATTGSANTTVNLMGTYVA